MNGGKTKQRYLDWWVNDLPPMHGLLRFVIYGGLFVLAWQMYKSPLRGITLYEGTDPELFRSFGLIKFLGIPYIAPEHLRTVIAVTSVAWIFAAIGLLTRVSAVVTALGVCFLHGLFLGSNALNHNYFLSMYALIALCFARTNDAWSVDYHLKKWWKGSPPIAGTGLIDTGFARKAFLILTVGYYFSAGITKLMVAGPIWADGHTIAYFAEQRGVRHPLSAMLSEHLWLCTILGVGTVVLEAGSIMALLSRKARLVLIFGWTLMHIGIRITVGPYYRENILCFALLIDWGAAVRAMGKRLPLRPRMLIEQTIGPTNKPARRRAIQVGSLSRRARRGVVAASLLVPLVLVVAFFQVFWWPLTNVYMYCSYFSNSRSVRADHPRADYFEAAAAQHIAREFLESQPPIEATEYFSYRANLRLAGGGLGPRYFTEGPPGIPRRKQWILTVVRPVLIEDLAAKPTGRIEFDPLNPDFPAQRLLIDYLPVLVKHTDPRFLRRYERLELTYPVGKSHVAIASVPLAQ